MNKIKLNIRDLSKFYPAVIFILVLIVYTKTLFYNTIFLDDRINVYEQNAGSSFFDAILKTFKTNYLANHYYRPITVISFIINSMINGTSPLFYHAANILIHLATSVMIFLLLNKLNYSKVISLFAALLFTLTPLQINAVGWISGRADLLAGLFSICSFFLFLGINNDNKLLRAWLIFFLVVCAILSKEVTLVIPFLFLLYMFIHPGYLTSFKQKLILIIIASSIPIVYVFIRALLAGQVHIDKFSIVTLITNIPAIAETIFKFFIPFGIKALPDYNLVLCISGFLLLIFLIVLPLYFLSINKNIYYFGIAWFILLMTPGMFFSTMAANGFFYWDCRSYTASLGLVIVAAEIFNLLKSKVPKKSFSFFTIIYMSLLAISTFVYVNLYENAVVYWASVSQDYPQRYLPHVQLFSYYSFIGDKSKSEVEIKKAVSLDPSNINNRSLLAAFYIKEQRYQDTFREATEGLRNNTDPNELTLVPYFIRSCGKLGKLEPLDNLISRCSTDSSALGRLRELFFSEADNLFKENDTPAYNIIMACVQNIDSILKPKSFPEIK